jgi:hypothetical protein
MAKAMVSATVSGDMDIASRRAMSDASSSGSRVGEMNSVSVKPRRDERAAQTLGNQFLLHDLAQGAHSRLAGGVDGLTGHPLLGGGGRDRDELARSLGAKDRQGGSDTVQHAAKVYVDHPVPVIQLT